MRDICDCHMHILDHRYPLWSGAVLDPPDASLADYSKLREKIGITHCVVAAPSIYGADNRCTRDAIASMGSAARGTAVLTQDTRRDEIAELARSGFVGARFNCIQGGPWSVDDIAPIARRVADFGWHVQVYAAPQQIEQMAGLLESLPTPIVFEHMARIRDPKGLDSPAFSTMLRLAQRGRAWVKLSAPYLEPDATPTHGARFAATVSAFVEAIPDRLVWGSDWPHATAQSPPDTARLLSEFCAAVADDATLDKILVDNPKRLYGLT